MIRAVALRAVALGLALVAGAAAAAPGRPAGRADRIAHHDPGTAPARGPANALVTIELFFVPGPTMPSTALRLLAQLQDRHPTRIRLVYRVLKGTSSILVPTAALEAHAQGRFFELLDELTRQRSALRMDDVREVARRAGVDVQRLELAYKRDQHHDLLEANKRRLERLHANPAPPSLLFNGRSPELSIAGMTPADLDRAFTAAEDRAFELLDRGFAPDELAAAFDAAALNGTQPVVQSAGGLDDDDDRSPLDHPLATPALKLAGLPSYGLPSATAVPVALLCRPTDPACSGLVRVLQNEIDHYPDEVRLVWAPWFDVAREDAAELSMLADAALCAEAISSNQGELTASPGWVWVREMFLEAGRGARRRLDADKLIDAVAAKLELDSRALAACRARLASSALDWIATARRSGVPRSRGAVLVIGGRIYEGLTEQPLIHALIEAELAPGVLGSLPRWDAPPDPAPPQRTK